MADRTIKPDDTNDLVLQNNDGSSKLELNEDQTVKITTGSDAGEDFTVNTSQLVVEGDTGNVGIGTSSNYTNAKLHIYGVNAGGDNSLRIQNANTTSGTTTSLKFTNTTSDYAHVSLITDRDRNLIFKNTDDTVETMRIDSSGNLLVGTGGSISWTNTAGFYVFNQSAMNATRDGNEAINLNRLTSDGDIAIFRKDGTTVGSIGSLAGANLYILNGDVGLLYQGNLDRILPCTTNGSGRDNAIDLGEGGTRFDDIYATNGTIQTSDVNEKQDIESLSEAEQRVAIVAKGLLRKFRWKSSVSEKGEDARIHFGIIAQDLKSAFEAEGLDAGRYAMFIHSEWWEKQTKVPAVEAQDAVYETQTDEEGNEVQVLVSEAVEAKEAYTLTETYDTEEEAPEGAVKKDRMGIRYSELLAFIIAAI